MPEYLAEIWAELSALPLLPLCVAALAAGIAYGFSGFGAALVFIPVSTAFIAPVLAAPALAIAVLSSFFTLIPKAWRDCDRRLTLAMLLAAFITLPAGILLLRWLDPAVLRWAILGISAVTLIALICGFRLPVKPRLTTSLSIAAASGVLGGATGMPGPLVILINLASGEGAQRVRANLLVFLTAFGLLFLFQLAVQGKLDSQAISLGFALLPIYALGNLIGRWIFDPSREALYRWVAYALIAASIFLGLPIFG